MTRRLRTWCAAHLRLLRIVVGVVLGCLILAALLRIRAEAHRTSGVVSMLRSSDRDELAAAAGLEVGSYLLPGVALGRICWELTYSTATRIAVAALGLGPLLPASPLTGSGIGYAELRRARIPSGRAATASTAVVIALPAVSMLVLAGPALIASGVRVPLPPGWRGAVLAAGALAVLLTGVLLALAAGASARVARLVRYLGGGRNTAVLIALGAGAWLCDAACLWLVGVALGISLPLACLPIAYIAGVTIMTLPVLPSGLGAVEATLPAIFAAGGASYDDALIAVLVWRVLSFWLPTVAGAVALGSLHRQPLPAAAEG